MKNNTTRPFLTLLLLEKKWLFYGFILATLSIFFSIGLMSLSGWFISATAYASLSYQTASTFNYFLPAAGVRFFSLARIVTRYIERLVTHDSTFKILTRIRVYCYQKLIPKAPMHLQTHSSNALLANFMDNIQILDELYLKVLSPICVALLTLFFLLFCLHYVNLFLALTLFNILCLYTLSVPYLTSLLSKRYSEILVKQIEHLKHLTLDYLNLQNEFKLANLESKKQTELIQAYKQRLKTEKSLAHITGIHAALTLLFLGISVTWALYQTCQLTLSHQISGAFIAFTILFVLASFEALMQLPNAFQQYHQTKTALQQLSKTLNSTHTPIHKVLPSNTFESFEFFKFPTENFTLSFQQVSFSYQAVIQSTLQQKSFSIPMGSLCAITGPSGSGKSTLAQLICRLYEPQSGAILLGEHKDIPLKNLAESEIQKHICYIEQEAHLFNATVRENFTLLQPKLSDQEILNALALLQLSERLCLDEWIGEQGNQLSGGQQKRLMLARAITSSASIILLDEPSEGLDAHTQTYIFPKIFEHFKKTHKTLIILTHNSTLLQNMNICISI